MLLWACLGVGGGYSIPDALTTVEQGRRRRGREKEVLVYLCLHAHVGGAASRLTNMAKKTADPLANANLA